MKNSGIIENIKNKLGLYNETMCELTVGIILMTLIAGTAGVFVFPDSVRFCGSLLIGSAGAMLLAVHMFVTISRSLDMYPEDAPKYAKRNYVLRLGFVILVVLCGLKLPFSSFPGIFLGLLTLKGAVYIRPLSRRILKTLVHRHKDYTAKEGE